MRTPWSRACYSAPDDFGNQCSSALPCHDIKAHQVCIVMLCATVVTWYGNLQGMLLLTCRMARCRDNETRAFRPRLHAVANHLAHHRQLHACTQVRRPTAGYLGHAWLVRQRDMVRGDLRKARCRPAEPTKAQHAELAAAYYIRPLRAPQGQPERRSVLPAPGAQVAGSSTVAVCQPVCCPEDAPTKAVQLNSAPLQHLKNAALVEVDCDQQRLHTGRRPEVWAVWPRGPRLCLGRGRGACTAEARSIASTGT